MRTMCSREIFTKKRRQQQIFDSDLKGAWHYNHVIVTPIAKKFMLYCTLIYMLSILCVRLTIKVKVGIPESFKVGWYPLKKTGSSHLKKREIFWLNNKAIIEFSFRRIWRILQISEGVIHLGLRPLWITPSLICRILPHILRKPNSIIANYSRDSFNY